MKLNNQSQLSRISRGVKIASIGGLIGLAFIANPAMAQDEAPADSPFSFIPEASKSVLGLPSADTTSDEAPGNLGIWSPPTTPVEPAPEWSPPETQVEPETLEPATSSMIQASAPNSVELEEAPPATTPESAVESTASALSEAAETPQIPDTAAIPSLDEPEVSSPLDFPEDEQLGIPDPSAEFDSVVKDESIVDSPGQPAGIATEEPFAIGRPVVNFPFRTPVRDALGGVSSILGGDQSVRATGQLTFLSLSRDYRGKGRILSNGVPNLLANGPDEGAFTGVDINYGRRSSNGRGWEMRFFGFDPGSASDVAGSNPSLAWGGVVAPFPDFSITETVGLSGIGFNGISMSDVFNNAGNHRVTRDSEFGSFEFNFLRASAGGQRMSCGNATVEFFGGLRGVTFNETIAFAAAAPQVTGLPRSASYLSEVKNNLFGLQIGGRLERQQANGWGYTFGSRVGIYNNRVESRQHASYQFDDGSSATPQILFGDDAGRNFDFDGKDNELAFLGELDFGFVYQFRPQVRARVGYRGVVITNVADGAGQFEENLFDADAVAEPKAFGDFFVGGLYFGVDYAF